MDSSEEKPLSAPDGDPLTATVPTAKSKLRICVLQSDYTGTSGAYADGLDPYCTPEEYDKEGRYDWHNVLIRKETAVQQIRDLARKQHPEGAAASTSASSASSGSSSKSRSGFDVFLNLCDGAFDEDRAGAEVVDALERCVQHAFAA